MPKCAHISMHYENYDPYFPDQPVVNLYLPIWAKLPSFRTKPAFIWAEDGPTGVCTNETIFTYEQLNSSAHSVSSKLLLAVQRRDTVVILSSPGLELVEIIFGCQRAGLLVVPISPPHPSFCKDDHHHLVRVLSQTKPKAAIAHSSFIKHVRQYLSSSASKNSQLSQLLKQVTWLSTEDLKEEKPDWQLNSFSYEKNSSIHPSTVKHVRQTCAAHSQMCETETSDLARPKSPSVKHVKLTCGVPGQTCKTDTSDLARQKSKPSYNGSKADEVYLIQYTSGATAIPKPILVTTGAAAHNVRTARKAYDLNPNSVIVSWLPQYHDSGLMFLLLTIVSGATCVLTSPRAFINRPRLWLELITKHKATCTPVPSFTLPLVVKRGEIEKGSIQINLSTMKNLILINEPIYNTSVEDFLKVFRSYGLNPGAISPSYGLAENCTFVSTAWRKETAGGHGPTYSDDKVLQEIKLSGSVTANFPVYKKLLPSARLALDGVDAEEEINILIVNEETHEPVNDGVEGEIWISSPSNASGYLGHPSLTQQVFNGRLRNRLTSPFVRTGDRGIVIGEERFLYVTGRCADMIKLSNNQEMHPHYIETTAYKSCLEFIRGGCVAAFEISETIVVVAEMQSEKEEKILKKVCEDVRNCVLKEEYVAVGLVVLVKSGNLPKTTSGKIQRWAAKHKLIRGKMDVLMKMKFGDHVKDFALMETLLIEDEKKGEDDRKVGKFSFSIPSKVPLLSSL